MMQVSASDDPSPCLGLGLAAAPPFDAGAREALKRIARQHEPVPPGSRLHEAGEPFTAIHAVRSGAVKTVRRDASGEERIVAFHLPGEFFGLSAIADGHYATSAVTLTTTAVCSLPGQHLFRLACEHAGLQRQLMRLLSGAIRTEQGQYAALAGHNAEVRLAFVLDQLRARMNHPAHAGATLRLPMTRAELGSSVGLAAETTSRLFHRFTDRGLIEARGRRITFLDPLALHHLGAPASAAEASAAAARAADHLPVVDSTCS